VVVKLTRVALLAPLLLVVAWQHRHPHPRVVRAASGPAPARPPILPLFVVLFLVAAAVRSTGVLSTASLDAIGEVESFTVSMGLAGLGAGVRIDRLRRVGGRPLVLGLVSWVLVAAVSYVAVQVAIA
jgi:uncharacterized membrane protein YadS